ncbi:MAG: Arylsulfatase [Phycisphaerales bacterium]|nr:Arylsulfatase [Phycisphaerales bacterium]
MRAALFLIVALLAAPSTRAAADAPRPNIILILADDMGFSDLGCYGGEIHTPHIDRLAKEGVRFAQFYNMARCCPTRAALLTGLYPHQAGMGAMNQDLGKPAYQGVLNDRCVTMAEVLKDSGYHTAMFGKWHLNHLTISGGGPRAKKLLNFEEEGDISPLKRNWPFNRGFEEHIGTIAGVDSYYDPYSLVHNGDVIRPPDKDFYYTDFITENAVKQIDRYAAQGGEGKPYFMYVAYTAPHWPLQAREADIAKYKETYTVGWDKIRQARFDRQTAMGLIDPKWGLSPRANYPRLSDGKSVLTAWDDAPEKEWQARRMAVYAAMIECMDRGVGQILDHLDSTAAAKNTVVIFLSDNGACAENVQPGWYDVPSKTRDGRPIHVGNDPKFMPGPEEVYQSYGPAWANASNTPFRRFKHWTEEGGISAPFIVRWPALIKGAGRIEQHQVGHVIDLMPTVMAITGATYPKRYHDKDIPPEEGKSLVPVLSGNTIDRGPLCWEHEGNRAIRLGDWKLVAAHNEPWQLYHITEDRTELNNLASANPEKVEELKTLYTTWAQRCGVEPWPVK